ncbi:hypothetical protein [Carboxylicivirga sp. M1479]|uniref:hypothetical protein n=1 Tax=Carboxylicivirga sp. M1479 TaxID=2594476 RepID=UPI001178CD0D|nr:hypothetical protein [Carboxylicivirga sp. M1479]TRX65815.1 hypothetical protein FNN09_17080 [Carboxylicivirga sp. M1479]
MNRKIAIKTNYTTPPVGTHPKIQEGTVFHPSHPCQGGVPRSGEVVKMLKSESPDELNVKHE